MRRQAQLRAARPDLTVVGVRGTVEARLAQLDAGDVDALVLAKAGLERLGLADRMVRELAPEVMLPGAGQGIIGAVCRADGDVLRLLRAADDAEAHVAAAAERAALDVVDAASEGGRPPLGVLMAREDACADGAGGGWVLRAVLARPDGSSVARVTLPAPSETMDECTVADAVELGRAAGAALLRAQAEDADAAAAARNAAAS